MDAEVRADRRVRVQAAQPHGQARLHRVHATESRSVRLPRATHRLLVRLRPARDRPVPEAGLEAAVAALPELRAGSRPAPRRPRRRRGRGAPEPPRRRPRRAARGLTPADPPSPPTRPPPATRRPPPRAPPRRP